ncbi:MAG: O-antigen ligase family protein [Candidatus Xenobia bacterium]
MPSQAPAEAPAFLAGFIRFTELVVAGALSVVVLYPAFASLDMAVRLYLQYLTGNQNWMEPLFLQPDAGAHNVVGNFVVRSAIAMAVTAWLLQRRHLRLTLRPAYLLSGLLVLLTLASTLLSTAPGDAIPQWMDWLVEIAFFWLLLDQVREPRTFRFATACLAFSGAVVAWCAIYRFGFEAVNVPEFHTNAESAVLTGAFFQPNVMAGYLVMVLPLTLAWMLSATTSLSRILLLVSAVGEGSALLLTISRGGWLTGLIVIAVFVALIRQQLPVLAMWAALCWCVFVAVGNVGAPHFRFIPWQATERVHDRAGEDSVAARKAFLVAGLKIALEHPLLGVGPDAFNRYYPQHQPDIRWYSRYSHSLYVDVMSEQGIPAFLTLLTLAAWCLWMGWRQRDDLLRCGLACAMLGSLLHAAIDVDWKFPTLVLTFMACAALLVVPLDGPSDEAIEGPGVLQLVASFGAVLLIGLAGLLFNAELTFQRGQASHDIASLQLAVREFPLHSDYLQSLMDAEVNAGKVPDAFALARRAVAVDSHRAVNWDRLGMLAGDMGQQELQKQAYARALQLDAVNFPQFYVHNAEVAPDRNHAMALLDEAVRRTPPELIDDLKSFRQATVSTQLAEVYTARGNLRADQQQYQGAIDDFTEALKLDNKNVLASLGKGVSLDNLHQSAAALPYLTDAVRLDPKQGAYHVLLAACYQHLGRDADCQKELAEAARLGVDVKKLKH